MNQADLLKAELEKNFEFANNKNAHQFSHLLVNLEKILVLTTSKSEANKKSLQYCYVLRSYSSWNFQFE